MTTNHPVAGRFVLLHRTGTTAEDDAYVTSWDTWDECSVAFPLERGFFLLDRETGREWLPGAAHETRERPIRMDDTPSYRRDW